MVVEAEQHDLVRRRGGASGQGAGEAGQKSDQAGGPHEVGRNGVGHEAGVRGEPGVMEAVSTHSKFGPKRGEGGNPNGWFRLGTSGAFSAGLPWAGQLAEGVRFELTVPF